MPRIRRPGEVAIIWDKVICACAALAGEVLRMRRGVFCPRQQNVIEDLAAIERVEAKSSARSRAVPDRCYRRHWLTREQAKQLRRIVYAHGLRARSGYAAELATERDKRTLLGCIVALRMQVDRQPRTRSGRLQLRPAAARLRSAGA